MELARFLPIARGDEPADLALRNGRVINVFTGEIIEADIAIAGDTIVGVGPEYEAQSETDLAGRYVCPGLIDAHVHVESSMVSPPQYARTVVPRGTTTAVTTTTAGGPTTVPPEAANRVVIGDDMEPATLNPFAPGSDNHVNRRIAQAIYAGLTDVHGETLEIVPDAAGPGTTVGLTTWGGWPTGLTMLVLVDLDGTPLFDRVGPFVSFDGSGMHTLSGPVPPGLTGSVATFQSFGFIDATQVADSNRAVLTFQ